MMYSVQGFTWVNRMLLMHVTTGYSFLVSDTFILCLSPLFPYLKVKKQGIYIQLISTVHLKSNWILSCFLFFIGIRKSVQGIRYTGSITLMCDASQPPRPPTCKSIRPKSLESTGSFAVDHRVCHLLLY